MKFSKLSLLSALVSLSVLNTAYSAHYNEFDKHYSLQGDERFINELKRQGINPDFESDDDDDPRTNNGKLNTVDTDDDNENSSFFDVKYKDRRDYHLKQNNQYKSKEQLEEEYQPAELTGLTGLPDQSDPKQIEQYRREYQYNIDLNVQGGGKPDVPVNIMQLKPYGLTMTKDYQVVYLDPRLNAKYGIKVRTHK